MGRESISRRRDGQVGAKGLRRAAGLEIARELEYLTSVEYDRLDAIATEAAKTVWGLLRKVSGAREVPVP